jgi:hypothetical protein
MTLTRTTRVKLGPVNHLFASTCVLSSLVVKPRNVLYMVVWSTWPLRSSQTPFTLGSGARSSLAFICDYSLSSAAKMPPEYCSYPMRLLEKFPPVRRIRWFNLLLLVITSLLAGYGLLFVTLDRKTVIFSVIYYIFSMLGGWSSRLYILCHSQRAS